MCFFKLFSSFLFTKNHDKVKFVFWSESEREKVTEALIVGSIDSFEEDIFVKVMEVLIDI